MSPMVPAGQESPPPVAQTIPVVPYVQDTDFTLYVGDVRQVLAELPAESVDCVVTSPPYWGLRDYGTDGQIGLEASPEEFVAEMVAVFRQVRRVLAPHGTLWLNLGDSYASTAPGTVVDPGAMSGKHVNEGAYRRAETPHGLKPKDLVGIPWRVAFALQADGWYLRADIIWSKPNPMPESVTDRPTKAHEYVFLLSKQPRYFFDQEAVREAAARWNPYGFRNDSYVHDEHHPSGRRAGGGGSADGTEPGTPGGRLHGTVVPAPTVPGKNELTGDRRKEGFNARWDASEADGTATQGRNVRSVWEIATQPYPDAHFATFPEALPERCIKAVCPVRVCVTCGKPSERITELTPEYQALLGSGKAWRTNEGKPDAYTNRQEKGHVANVPPKNVTTGWSDCGHGNYRPGVVLDPFIGSGTTALVARRHGRHTIGIELNPEYAELAARRLSQLSLLAEETA